MLDTAIVPDPGGSAGRQRLLLGGAAAGLTGFAVTFLVEGATRPGYSPWRHAVSQLSLGLWLGQHNRHPDDRVGPAGLRRRAPRALPIGTGSTRGPRLPGLTGAGFLLAAASTTLDGQPVRRTPSRACSGSSRPGHHRRLRVPERGLLRHGPTLRRRSGPARLGAVLDRHRPGGGRQLSGHLSPLRDWTRPACCPTRPEPGSSASRSSPASAGSSCSPPASSASSSQPQPSERTAPHHPDPPHTAGRSAVVDAPARAPRQRPGPGPRPVPWRRGARAQRRVVHPLDLPEAPT